MYWMKARDIPIYEVHFQKVSSKISPHLRFIFLFVFSVFLLIYPTCVCMSRFYQLIGLTLIYIYIWQYHYCKLSYEIAAREGPRCPEHVGLSLMHNIDGWVWLTCIDSPPSIIPFGIIGKALFHPERCYRFEPVFFSNNFDAGDWLLYEVIKLLTISNLKRSHSEL